MSETLATDRDTTRQHIAKALRGSPSGLSWEWYAADLVMAEVVDPLLTRLACVRQWLVHLEALADGDGEVLATIRAQASELRRALEDA